MNLKKFCEQNGYDLSRALNLVIGKGGSILPQKVGFQGYFAIINEDGITFQNDVLQVKKDVLFESFTYAEFGIGNAQLWLQCMVDDSPFVFCMRRKDWKSPQGKLILEKIAEHTEIKGWKEYNGYTGKKFLLYVWK